MPRTRLGLGLGLTQPGAGGGGGDPILNAALALSPVLLYDHKDIGSFFTDVTMTTQATVGDPVAAVKDKSVNLRHRTQATLGNRPILRQAGSLYYLEYDGVDDFMVTAAVNLTATDAFTACFGIRKLSDAAVAMFLEFSENLNFNNGAFYLTAPEGTGANGDFRTTTKGTANAVTISSGILIAPATRVITLLSKIATPERTMRLNGIQAVTSAVSLGTGNLGNYSFYFGRRGGITLPFTGHDYGGAIYATNHSGASLDAIEDFVADRTGVTL